MTIDSQLGKAWCWTDPTPGPDHRRLPAWMLIAWTGTSDVPTEAPASPLFGATPFTQQLLLFEEFGPETMPTGSSRDLDRASSTLLNAQNGPDPADLEAFLAQDGVSPFPTRLSNVIDTNPWKPAIETFLGRTLCSY